MLLREATGRLVDVACWVHGRRGFEEAIPATSHVLVQKAMIWTQQLNDIEDRAKGMSAEERRALRQAEALPILARMKARFEEVRPTLRPTAKLAEAIDYVLNRWDAFVRYTEDGRIPIDNNVIERLLRPVAIGRKNYLFFGSEHGGKTAATLYTLVQSARRNCVDVWPYLTDVLRRIAAIAPATRLPWRPYCRIAGWPPIPSIGWSSGKKNPVKPRPAAAGNGPHAGSPPPNRRLFHELPGDPASAIRSGYVASDQDSYQLAGYTGRRGSA